MHKNLSPNYKSRGEMCFHEKFYYYYYYFFFLQSSTWLMVTLGLFTKEHITFQKPFRIAIRFVIGLVIDPCMASACISKMRMHESRSERALRSQRVKSAFLGGSRSKNCLFSRFKSLIWKSFAFTKGKIRLSNQERDRIHVPKRYSERDSFLCEQAQIHLHTSFRFMCSRRSASPVALPKGGGLSYSDFLQCSYPRYNGFLLPLLNLSLLSVSISMAYMYINS